MQEAKNQETISLRKEGKKTMIELGEQYFHLTPIKVVAPPSGIKDQHKFYLCKCTCGKEKIVSSGNLGRSVKSCGCKRYGHRVTHGFASHNKIDRLYRIWKGIKYRCENPKSKDYKHYGGRGITICREWQCDFMVFRNWALSHGYDNDLTIDRIDVDGNYEPENCRWITRAENNRTKRKGKEKTK